MCLSTNEFNTIIFATISGQRDVAKLAARNTGKGEFELNFEFDNDANVSNKTFVMIEAPALFEAIFYDLFSRNHLL